MDKKLVILSRIIILTIIGIFLIDFSQVFTFALNTDSNNPSNSNLPNITLISPLNNNSTKNQNITFSFSVTKNYMIDKCYLLINNNQTVREDHPIPANSIMNYFLFPENYNWSIQCLDRAVYGGDIIQSEIRILNILQNSSKNITGNNTIPANNTLPGNNSITNNTNTTMHFLIINLTFWPNPGDLVYIYPEHPLTEEGGFQYSFINSSTVDTCLLFIDNQSVATSKNNDSINDFNKWNYLVTNFTTEDTKHTWKVFCNTTSGLYNYSETRVLYFLTYSKLLAPIVHLTWPINNQIFNYDDGIALYFDYTNTSTIKNCSLFIDNNLISYRNDTGNWTDVSEWPNSTGVHTWSYSCCNVYGSTGNSETRSYYTLDVNIIPEDVILFYESANNDLSDIQGLFILSRNYSEGIYFNENINLFKESNLSDFISMTENRIFVDSTKAPWLNKKASLVFYYITFNNPQILKDGAIFNTDFYYENETFAFNVDGFSEYKIQETPQAPSSGGRGGGGSRGGRSSFTKNTTNVTSPKLVIKQNITSNNTIKQNSNDTDNVKNSSFTNWITGAFIAINNSTLNHAGIIISIIVLLFIQSWVLHNKKKKRKSKSHKK